MIKAKHISNIINILEYVLFIMNGVIAFRLIVLYIDLNQFIDYNTGRMSFMGKNIKFFQTIIINLTNPLINPFKNTLMDIMGQSNTDLVTILAPAFLIVVLLLIIAILKLTAPSIMRYIRKIENRNA